MRGPLSYLIAIKLKNQLKELLKSPGKLIYLLFIVALVAVTLLSSGASQDDPGHGLRDIRELIAAAIMLYAVLFVLLVNNGFDKGASMFTMPDVNLLFPSPVKPQRALLYGLLRQMGSSMLLGFFLLFQYTWMRNVYGIGYGILLAILAGYALTVFLGQLTAMALYSFTSADERKKRIAQACFYALIAASVLYVAACTLTGGASLLENAVQAMNSVPAKALPVFGWLGAAVSGVILNSAVEIALGLILCAAYAAALVCAIAFIKQDYYEDVLLSTQIAQSAITARKEGIVGEAVPKNVKTGRIGLGKGWGADALYYKHAIEERRARVLLFNVTSLSFTAAAIIMAFIMKQAGILPVFAATTYMQVFTIALGRFSKELTKPYIYLMPEPPLKKLLFGLAQSLPGITAQAVVTLVPVSIILGLDPLEAALCILARISFDALFSAANVAVERLWGGSNSKGLAMLLYLAIVIAMMIPGIALGVLLTVLGYVWISQSATLFLAMAACNIPVCALVLFLCRNMLQYAEFNQR